MNKEQAMERREELLEESFEASEKLMTLSGKGNKITTDPATRKAQRAAYSSARLANTVANKKLARIEDLIADLEADEEVGIEEEYQEE